jgi:hypothetical protein
MYDVHLLIQALSDDQAEAFVRMAVDRRMALLCSSMIQEAYETFQHPRAADLARRLSRAGAAEPVATLMHPRPWWTTLHRDLRAVPRWSDRLRLVAGHAFPPAAYMRATYAPTSRAPLPWLYARRFARVLSRTDR